MSDLHFLRPWALALIVPAVLLWLASRQANDTTRRWARVIEPELKTSPHSGQRSCPPRRSYPHRTH